VVVGHSMGARVAMRMAADFPGEIRACILEDMDARARGPHTAYDATTSMALKLDYPGARAFDPVGPSVADVAARLSAAMPLVFDAERVSGYVERKRIAEAPGGTAVSLVHPLGFALAYDKVSPGLRAVTPAFFSAGTLGRSSLTA